MFRRRKWIWILYTLIFIIYLSYPYILHYLGVFAQETPIFEQVNLAIGVTILFLTIVFSQPFTSKYSEPHIVIDPFVELFHSDKSEPLYAFGWKIRNIGRETARNVTVTARFILATGKISDTIDREYILLREESLLPPKGHQPDFEIRLNYKKGQDKFALFLLTKKVDENIINRVPKWESLPFLEDFDGEVAQDYTVVIRLDGENLREQDRKLKKYVLDFAGNEPKITLMKEEVADFYKQLRI